MSTKDQGHVHGPNCDHDHSSGHAHSRAEAQEPVRKQVRPGRNDPCWCDSGKKYKKCHLVSDESGT